MLGCMLVYVRIKKGEVKEIKFLSRERKEQKL